MTLIVCSGLAGAVGGWFVNWRFTNFPPKSGGKLGSVGRLRVLQSVVSGLLLSLLALKIGTPSALLFIHGGLFLVLVGIAIFDFQKFEIPNAVTVPGMLIGLVLGAFVLPLGFRESLMGLLVGGGVLLAATLIETIRKKDIGGGDWKYAAMIGTFIGPRKIVTALILAAVFGFIGAAVLAVSGKHREPQALGPWLSIGGLASILLG